MGKESTNVVVWTSCDIIIGSRYVYKMNKLRWKDQKLFIGKYIDGLWGDDDKCIATESKEAIFYLNTRKLTTIVIRVEMESHNIIG